MQLIVRQADAFVKELHFAQGPIYIGRELASQVCLLDDTVAIEHAVLCGADSAEWFAEHLDGKCETLLNGSTITRSPVRDGDVLTVGPFQIEVLLSDAAESATGIHMHDTLRTGARMPKNIVRRYDQSDSPEIRVPARRQREYVAATIAIEKAATIQELLKTLLAVSVQQLKMFHTFIGLRLDPAGLFNVQIGKRRTGQTFHIEEMLFQQLVKQAMEKKEYILVPMLPKDKLYERIRSAVIAPILSPLGCHGVFYADNSTEDSHFTLNDVDYLMLITTHLGAKLMMMRTGGMQMREMDADHSAPTMEAK